MTPDSIRKKTFMTVKGGYDIDEVEDYLDQVAKEFDELAKKNDENEEKIIKLVDKINEYREDEEAIKNALLISQRESNKIINDAKAQARDMIESAKTEQIRLAEQSDAECKRIINEHKENCAKLIKENTDITEKKIALIRSKYTAEKEEYDNLKREVTLFKAKLLPLYKEQLALIMQIPEAPVEAVPAPVEEPAVNEEEEKAAEEAAAEEAEKAAKEAAEAAAEAEKEHIDKILNTGSFEPVLPKENLQDLRFGKNN